MVSEETIKNMKDMKEELHKIERHGGVPYSLDRAFTCFNKKFPDGTRRPCTELLDYYKISYREPKDDHDDSINTLNFCFAKRKDQIDITTYRNINKIHLNYANLAKTHFWGDKKYNIVIRNDHKKKFFTFMYHLNTIIGEPKPYLARLWKFLSLNQENIESIEFININCIMLPSLKRMCRDFGIKVIDSQKEATNTKIQGNFQVPSSENTTNASL